MFRSTHSSLLAMSLYMHAAQACTHVGMHIHPHCTQPRNAEDTTSTHPAPPGFPSPVASQSLGHPPLQCGTVPLCTHRPRGCLLLREAGVVEQLAHCQVGKLFHECECFGHIEEHGKEELLIAGGHTDALREEEGGILLQPRHIYPLHHQAHWDWAQIHWLI